MVPQNRYERKSTTYDNRTAGLFKTEFVGDGMICLSSKLYYCLGEPNKSNKFSCKGVQKKNNSYVLNYNNFKNVLHSNISMEVENIGMRYINGGVYYYSSCKTGLSSKYDKRTIMSDRVSTYPLGIDEYK